MRKTLAFEFLHQRQECESWPAGVGELISLIILLVPFLHFSVWTSVPLGLVSCSPTSTSEASLHFDVHSPFLPFFLFTFAPVRPVVATSNHPAAPPLFAFPLMANSLTITSQSVLGLEELLPETKHSFND